MSEERVWMLSEEMHQQLKEDMGIPEREERGPPVRLALVHFSPAEAAMMWEAMQKTHEELEEFDERYDDPVGAHERGEDVSIERLGRYGELQAGRRGYPMTSDDHGVPVVESAGSLKERAKLRAEHAEQ